MRARPELSLAEQLRFAEGMHRMLASGIPVGQAIRLLSRQNRLPKNLMLFYQRIGEALEKGRNFSEAIEESRFMIPSTQAILVRGAEKAGNLKSAFAFMAKYLSGRLQMRKKLISASLYPAIVLVVSCLVVALLGFLVIPKFESIFLNTLSGGKAELPLLTRIVFGAANSFWVYGAILFLAVAGFWGIGKLKGRGLGVGRLPLLERLVRQNERLIFVRTLGLLLEAKIPLEKALPGMHMSFEHPVLRRGVPRIQQQVLEGSSLSEALQANPVLAEESLFLIQTGEQTGNLAEALASTAEGLEIQIEGTLKNMTTLAEPILIVGLAVFVGIVVASLLLPMGEFIQNISMF